MANIAELLQQILAARYGKDVRQAIHDSIELGYNIASDAEAIAETAQDSASASATAAANSASAAQTAANNASISASLAEQYKEEAFHTTPTGYEDFVSETNSSLDYLYNSGVKNIWKPRTYFTTNNGTGDGTITYNEEEGTVIVNGTFTDMNIFQSYFSMKAGNYRVSGCPSGGNIDNRDGAYYLYAMEAGADGGAIIDIGNGRSMSLDTDVTNYQLTCLIRKGTYNNLVFKPMITDASCPNSNYAHHVPYAQSNEALTKNTLQHSAINLLYNENVSCTTTLAKSGLKFVMPNDGIVKVRCSYSNARCEEIAIISDTTSTTSYIQYAHAIAADSNVGTMELDAFIKKGTACEIMLKYSANTINTVRADILAM